jgi:hypothetical protein
VIGNGDNSSAIIEQESGTREQQLGFKMLDQVVVIEVIRSESMEADSLLFRGLHIQR